VAVGTEYRGGPDGGRVLAVSGIAVDGIEAVRFIRPGADDHMIVPIRDNVFRVDVSDVRPRPTELRWRDWRGERSFDLRPALAPEG
jgi:hypothetical protein